MDNTFTFTVPGYTITVVGTEPVAPAATVVEVSQGEVLQVKETDAATPALETSAT